MTRMLRPLRVLFLRFAILAVAATGFLAILMWVHDYPQTRQAISNYHFSDGMLWFVMFYFINEAGSGIKYEITGDKSHLVHYPRMDLDRTGRSSRRDFELAMYGAKNGDWQEQLRVSHLYALGWGVEKNLGDSILWYQTAKETATTLGKLNDWNSSSRRKSVRAIILPQLRVHEIEDKT